MVSYLPRSARVASPARRFMTTQRRFFAVVSASLPSRGDAAEAQKEMAMEAEAEARYLAKQEEAAAERERTAAHGLFVCARAVLEATAFSSLLPK